MVQTSKPVGRSNRRSVFSSPPPQRQLILVPSVATRLRLEAESQARSVAKSPLFMLPREVRAMIYKQLMRMSTIHLRPTSYRVPARGLVAFLCACKICHHDLKPLLLKLFELATFNIPECIFAIEFLESAEQKRLCYQGIELTETSSQRMRFLQVSKPFAFPEFNDEYDGIDEAWFEHLQELCELQITINIDVGVANVDGSFEVQLDLASPAKTTFNSPRDFATFLERNLTKSNSITVVRDERVKKVTAKARRRCDILQPSMSFDVKIDLYTVKELEEMGVVS